MRALFKHLVFLCFLSYGLFCCLLLYSKGFLLSRNVIPYHSVCSTSKLFGENASKDDDVGTFQDCFPSDTKCIVIVIDALRYDFVAKYSGEDEKVYHNNLKFVHHLLAEKNHSRLYKFIADPPTTTMQRLHGLMTGSLPTFIDIGSNFASYEITEDNLLSQLRVNGKKTIFLGDDTWMNLFPNDFERSFPYPSFNVWDLDTVDSGVSENIVTEIEKSDWNLLIAHYLGVDHCGHRYGPNHPEMKRKLLEMDRMIKLVTDVMDNTTVLFVMGDHGMTENGDHGGESEDEITAAIFAYSKTDLNSPHVTSSAVIHQIDILPTISSILGVPIPFSNLGILVYEMIPVKPSSYFELSTSDTIHFQLIKNNIKQITNYIKVYNSRNNHFPPHTYENILQGYEALREYKNISTRKFISDANFYMKSVQDMCKNVWTQFDFGLIIIGMTLFSFFLYLLVTIKFVVDKLQVTQIFIYFFAIIMSVVLKFLFNILDVYFLLFFIVFSCLGCVFLIISCTNFYSLTQIIKFICFGSTMWAFPAFIIYSCSFIGLFSNSYIISENRVITFLLSTMVLLTYFQIITSNSFVLLKIKIFTLNLKSFVILIVTSLCFILRILSLFWQCYDQQSLDCGSNKVSTLLSSCFTISVVLIFFKLVNLLLFNLNNSLETTIFKSAVLSLIIMSSFFWLMNNYVTSHNIRNLDWFINIFPQIVGLFVFIVIIYCFVDPFKYVKRFLILSNELKSYSVFSFKCFSKKDLNIYLNIYIMLALLCWIFSFAIFNERRILSSIFLFLSIFLLIFLLGLNKVLNITDVSELFELSLWDLVAWHLSTIVHFYGTGHQPNFPSLQWECVGPFIEKFPMFVPGILMIINTFISHIVHSLLLPLLLIVPMSIFYYCNKYSDFKDFQPISEEIWRKSLTFLFLKTIALQGFRVLVIMLSAAIHSRHLMVWNIFAPKMIFEAVGFSVSLLFLILSFFLIGRITNKVQSID